MYFTIVIQILLLLQDGDPSLPPEKRNQVGLMIINNKDKPRLLLVMLHNKYNNFGQLYCLI